jgi:succinate dehydrogenase / fumarate reductase, iron-sulfur subunit
MNLELYVWRQSDARSPGGMVRYEAEDITLDMSFLEMLDVVNLKQIENGEEPIAFDSDCREGILRGAAVCQLHMRSFKDGETIYIEPWRSRAFPVIKDLVVDRSALDRIIQAGGYISVSTGSAPEANTILVSKQRTDLALDAAACIQCGACVAACPNGSAALFTASKVSNLALLPQGQPERNRRVISMVAAMDREGFGACSMHRECEAVCPKEISVNFIARMNWERLRAGFTRFGE